MTVLVTGFRTLLGLFVDDGALALTIIVVVFVAWTLSTLLLDMPIVAGAVLLIGCLVALFASVMRAARR
jgi:hypothetical protein